MITGGAIVMENKLPKGLSVNAESIYPDGRPSAKYRMEAKDQGIIIKHGGGPKDCDTYGMRQAMINKENDVYHLFYDATSKAGVWCVCLTTSGDLVRWEKKGPLMELGLPGDMDSKYAGSPWVYKEGSEWHMFYIGSHNVNKDDGVPSFPYLTLKARSISLSGPWMKQKDVIPFRTKSGTYYSESASAGHIVKHNGENLQFFSGSPKQKEGECVLRTLGIARTKDLNTAWTPDNEPIVPAEEQIENSSLYFEPACKKWFLFTNHIGLEKDTPEYTDAIWVYWSSDLNKWYPKNKAVVLDGKNCKWSKRCIGLPTVLPIGNRLAIFYDAPGGNSISHLNRDAGLAWLDLPLLS